MANPQVFQFFTLACDAYYAEFSARLRQLGANCVMRKTDTKPECWYGVISVAGDMLPAELRQLLGMPMDASVYLTEGTYEELLEVMNEGPVEYDLFEDDLPAVAALRVG